MTKLDEFGELLKVFHAKWGQLGKRSERIRDLYLAKRMKSPDADPWDAARP